MEIQTKRKERRGKKTVAVEGKAREKKKSGFGESQPP